MATPVIGTMVAKRLMRIWEASPKPPGEEIGECQEIFNHPRFVHGSEAERRRIMHGSAEAKYRSELAYPWDHYFGRDLTALLRGKEALDLGCFTGGRGVAWAERYGLRRLVGIDVAPHFIDAAQVFAAHHGVPARFDLGTAEAIPLADASVDAVLSYDVFEHVRDVPRALAECARVLRPGGRLFLVFPSYYQPIEHHLALATRCPGLHYLFSGRTLVRAYWEILNERGRAAEWYGRSSPDLEPWERGNTVNGITLARFRGYVREQGWTVVHQSRKPIGSIGRNASKSRLLKIVALLCDPLARIPGLEEIFLHRITYVLEKPVQ